MDTIFIILSVFLVIVGFVCVIPIVAMTVGIHNSHKYRKSIDRDIELTNARIREFKTKYGLR